MGVAIEALPEAVGVLFDGDAATAFASDALLAWWDGSGDERAARSMAHGRAEIRRVLRCPARPDLLAAVHDGRDCFVEGRLANGGTFVASLQLDGAGLIRRLLSFHCDEHVPRPAGPAQSEAPPGAARAILERYFAHLSAGEFAAASACFSDDCLYSHPPYGAGTARVAFRGRAG